MTFSLALNLRLTSPLRPIDSSLSFNELENPVTVSYDSKGIPHIIASSNKDLFIADGYLMARDRLWEMDFYRRQAKGQLSEIFSSIQPDIIDTDYSLRAIGLYRISQRDWSTLSEKTRDFFQWFADGVNIYIKENSNRLPIEFGILSYIPDLWNPIDSLAIIKLMAVGLTFHGGGEPLIGEAIGNGMNLTELLDLARLALNDKNVTFSDPVGYPSKEITSGSQLSSLSNIVNPLNNILKGISKNNYASNNWVISGNLTRDGYAFLANDPHLNLETPSVWWQVDLKDPDFHISGMVLPGIPGIVLGRNDNIAFGATNSQIDFLDTYVETFSPDYKHYYYKNAWYKTQILPEKFYLDPSRTRFKEKDIYITTGENISSSEYNFAHGDRPVVPMLGENVSIRWVAQDSSRIADLISKLPYVSNYQEFNETMYYWNAPGQNIVYIDKSGNIGLWVTGDIPIRKAGFGFAPHNGSIDTYEWQSYVPFSQNYHVLNPPEGYIATANDRFIPSNYPYFLGWAFDNPYRADRISSLLNKTDQHTFESMMSIQTDVYSLASEEFLPFLLNTTIGVNQHIKLLQTMLSTWNHKYTMDSTAASIMGVWSTKIYELVFKDQLPSTLFNNIPLKDKLLVNTLMRSENDYWFDDVNTPIKETKTNILIQSMNETYNYLVKKFGEDMSTWVWGSLHKTTFSHIFGSVLPFFNGGGTFSSPGADDTIAVGTFDNNFHQNHGPSMRQIFSLQDTNSYFSVLAPGNSGIINSPNFDNQIYNWATGHYFTVPINYSKP
ncbi:MAG: penicillin acylase family protein [Candidatus Thorarchaeota archaeon]